MKNLGALLLIYFVAFTVNIKPQVVYDTLYLFPDTTTFFDHSNGLITDDMANFAVKLKPNTMWNKLKIESINLLFFNRVFPISVYLKISTGYVPEEVVLYSKYFIIDSNYSYFPNWQTFIPDTELFISSKMEISHFYVSGLVFLGAASSYYGYPSKMNQFYFNPFNYTWYEGLPVYLPIKVVVSKVAVGIEEASIEELESWVKIFPNPFNYSTIIQYVMHKQGRVAMKLHDVLGREIKEILNTEQYAGEHRLILRDSDLSSGVYYLKIIGDNYMAVKKISIIK